MRITTAKRATPTPEIIRVFADGLKRVRFDGSSTIAEDCKKFTAVKVGDVTTDYQDVTIKGYLSTFQDTTASDREGDYVLPGAFKATIPMFMQNPVLLCDHDNDCESIAGRFTAMKEDKTGLYFEAALSNCPCDDHKCIRFMVAEGNLKTTSMGGVFTYGPDGRGIKEVQLFEGSLTPVPVNQDAIFSTRALTPAEALKVRVVPAL